MSMTRPMRSTFIHRVDVRTYDTEATDPAAGLAPGQAVQAVNVRCLVIDKGGGRAQGYGRELERKKVRVLFRDRISLRQGQALAFNGRILLIDSFRDDVDMGHLWVAECSEEPDPRT